MEAFGIQYFTLTPTKMNNKDKEPMTAKEAIKILKEHQNWRLGKTDIIPCHPKVLTAAIDTLLEEIEILKAENKELQNTIDRL
jgi:hypothetical protein